MALPPSGQTAPTELPRDDRQFQPAQETRINAMEYARAALMADLIEYDNVGPGRVGDFIFCRDELLHRLRSYAPNNPLIATIEAKTSPYFAINPAQIEAYAAGLAQRADFNRDGFLDRDEIARVDTTPQIQAIFQAAQPSRPPVPSR